MIDPFQPGSPEVEVVRGTIDYKDFLRTIHERLAPKVYLEIGVRHGASLSLASCRSVGVDPAPEITFPMGRNTLVVQESSDGFFEYHAGEVLSDPPDLVFIDGMHLFEYALRDFINVELISAPTTLVVVDDVFPNHPRQASPQRKSRVWAGDVWKLHRCLAELRPDLFLLPVDISPTGLLLIAGLNPASQILGDQYPSIVERFNSPSYEELPSSVLSREGALPGDSPLFQQFLEGLRELRSMKATTARVAYSLATLRPSAA